MTLHRIMLQDKALAMPTEQQMRPKDKYTVFSRTDPGYRKSLHKVREFLLFFPEADADAANDLGVI